ncbi:MAG: hypothetical protein K0S76_1633 [Herbinix sp.]|jgi:hypothetical protein|nr:hypothetical protein [Herbinix sp.]
MRHKSKIAALFFILSLVFALLSLPFSGALTRGSMDRAAYAKVVEDKNGVLKLIGFDDKYYDLKNKNKSENVGSITNNTIQNITLSVTIAPDFTIYHILSRFELKIGDKVSEFRFGSSSPKQVTLTLKPGQTVEVSASLSANLFGVLSTQFYFTATDNAGTYTMQLGHTQRTPRRIHCY